MCGCEGSYVCPSCEDDDHFERMNEPEGPPDDYGDGTWASDETEAGDDGHPRTKTVVVDDTGATDEIERR